MLGAAEGTAVGTPVGAEDTMPEEYGCLDCLLVAPSRRGRTGAAPWQTPGIFPAEGSRVPSPNPRALPLRCLRSEPSSYYATTPTTGSCYCLCERCYIPHDVWRTAVPLLKLRKPVG